MILNSAINIEKNLKGHQLPSDFFYCYSLNSLFFKMITFGLKGFTSANEFVKSQSIKCVNKKINCDSRQVYR